MVTADDLAADWKRMRHALRRQLVLIETGKMRTGGRISNGTTSQTLERIRRFLAELDLLLANHRGCAHPHGR